MGSCSTSCWGSRSRGIPLTRAIGCVRALAAGLMGRTLAAMDASDETLMVRVAVGDSTALETLIHRYRKRIYGVLVRGVGRSADADDLFQETWIRVARRAATFDPTRPFAPWVARVAANLAIDWLRTNAKTSLADPDEAFERASGARDPEQA